jgi:hypothetical protein
MKKLLILFLVFSAGIRNVFAQIPGYQGKRLTVGYNASSFFYVINIFDNPFSDIIDNTRISYKSEFNVNYAVSRKAVMGVSYYFANQRDNFTDNLVTRSGGYYKPVNETVKCRLSIYELHIQLFRKNFIAPVGLYHQFSIGLVKYTLADDSMQFRNTDNYNSTYILAKPHEPFTGFKLGYSIGKTNPIGHNFYLNTAFGVNFFRGGDTAKIRTGVYEQNYLLTYFNQNLRSHNFFELKLGLGWIAF